MVSNMVTYLTVTFTANLMYDQPSIASTGLLYCLWSVYRCSGLTLICDVAQTGFDNAALKCSVFQVWCGVLGEKANKGDGYHHTYFIFSNF